MFEYYMIAYRFPTIFTTFLECVSTFQQSIVMGGSWVPSASTHTRPFALITTICGRQYGKPETKPNHLIQVVPHRNKDFNYCNVIFEILHGDKCIRRVFFLTFLILYLREIQLLGTSVELVLFGKYQSDVTYVRSS